MNRAMTILLVEDEFLNRSLVQAILSRARDERLQSAVVSEAETLGAARQSLSEGEPDVILLDVQLPDGSGLDLARQLRAGSAAAEGPLILALTAGALPEQQAAAIDAGCDAVILKPYTADEFESVLVKYLDQRDTRAADDTPA
jgi:CheY-like chemotaxis protein